MASAHASVLYDVNDFKVNALLTDVTTAPTYSAVTVDVPGISAVTFDPNFIVSQLKGDAQVIANRGVIDMFKMSATYGRLSLDATAVFMGGTVADVTTPAAATWTIGANNQLPYFKAQFQTLNGETPDCHITAYKNQLTGGTLIDLSTNNFNQPKLQWDAIPSQADLTLFVKVEILTLVTPLV